MHWRVGVILFAAGWAGGFAEETAPPVVESIRPKVVQLYRLQSLSFPLAVLGPNQQENARWLEAVEKAHREFPVLLGEAVPKSVRFEYVWVPSETVSTEEIRPDLFPRQVRPGGMLTWVVDAKGAMPRDRDALWRTSFLCQIQALALTGSSGPSLPSELADPPFWITEGMTQMLSPQRLPDWNRVVGRYSRTEKRPSLRTVQEWQELGDDKLERLYRSVFCHRLFRAATETEAERRSLSSWLKLQSFDPRQQASLYWAGNSRQEVWWRENTSQPLKQLIPLYSWDASANHLREAMHFSVRMKGEEGKRLATVTAMPEKPEDLEDLEPVKEAVNRLLMAESQAHPVWRPICLQYRAALELWLSGRYGAYQAALEKAGRMQEQAGRFMEEVEDYLNWVTVNFPMGQPDGSYSTYSELVRLLEQEKAPLPQQETSSPP